MMEKAVANLKSLEAGDFLALESYSCSGRGSAARGAALAPQVAALDRAMRPTRVRAGHGVAFRSQELFVRVLWVRVS